MVLVWLNFHSPSAADFNRPDIMVPTDPLAPTKLLTMTETPASTPARGSQAPNGSDT